MQSSVTHTSNKWGQIFPMVLVLFKTNFETRFSSFLVPAQIIAVSKCFYFYPNKSWIVYVEINGMALPNIGNKDKLLQCVLPHKFTINFLTKHS